MESVRTLDHYTEKAPYFDPNFIYIGLIFKQPFFALAINNHETLFVIYTFPR